MIIRVAAACLCCDSKKAIKINDRYQKDDTILPTYGGIKSDIFIFISPAEVTADRPQV